MNQILTIGGRQFRSYFNGPVAYIVICIVMLTLGFFFWNTFFLFGRASARAANSDDIRQVGSQQASAAPQGDPRGR